MAIVFEYIFVIAFNNKSFIRMNSTGQLQETFTQLNLPFDQWFIDLHDYESMNQRIQSNEFYIDQVVQKNTGKYFSVHIITKRYKRLNLHEDIYFSRNLHLTITLNHRSILKFYGLNPIGYTKAIKPVILTEYTPYGFLRYFLENETNPDNPNALWNSAKKLINIYDIACAIRYLHSKNIIYLYLSPESILLDDFLYPKLFDFGRCAHLGIHEGCLNIRSSYASRYVAPEILLNDEYTKKSDTYSFSLIIYRIITGEEPFQIDDYFVFWKKIRKGYRPKFNKTIPSFYKNLIEKCWSENPDDRPSFDEIVEILKTPDESFFNSKDEFDEYKLHFNFNINNYEMLAKISEKDNYSTYILMNNQTRNLFTCKIYSKGEEELPYRFYIKKEVKLHKILLGFDHPSLLKFIGYSLFDLQSRPYLTIINEYAQISLNYALNLSELNGKSSWWTPTKVLINIFGIVSGMKYLHSHGYIHCNLSTETILEDKKYYPKITDFEKMEKISDDPYKQSKTSTFITKYFAPEVIKTGNCSKCSDVYSFAYILYELITNKKPFEEFKTEQEIIEAISNGFRPEIPSSVPKCYKDLIESCWSEDPDLRPSFHQISRKLEFKEDFILDNVDHVEFQNYIEKVGQHQNKELYNKFEDKIGEINRINIAKYEKLDKTGKNKNAIICIAREISTGKILQAEILFKEIEEFNEDEIEHLALEVKILDKLKHKAIISFIGFSMIDFKKFDRPVILTEIVKNGSLHDYIEQETFLNNSDSDWNAVKKLINIYGIASAMSQLHKNNIINRNLKSENILLDQLLYPKLSDFKICFDISDKNDDRANCMKKSDVYSFGLIVYEILTNKVPYEDDSTLTTNTHFDLLLGNEIPLCFKILIEKCLKQVPFDRPSFEEIISTLKTQEFITFLNSEDQKEEYFNYIYSIESENQVGKAINIYKYQMISKICDKFNSEIFKIQEKSTKKYFAAKAFTKEKEELPDEYEKQKNVHKILLNLDHPSLLKYIGYSPFNHEYKPHLTTINEYAQSSLFDVLEKKEEIEGWSSTKKLINIYGIASAMNYLHSNGFIHRNLSTDNILEDENFYPKITGFNEITSIFQLNVNNAFFDYPKYAAPEVIKSKQYSKASDVYAFSIILYELVTGKKPFAEFKSDFHIQDAVCKGYRPEIPKSVPSVYKVLIESCWSQDPDCRPTFSQVVDYFETEEDFIFYDAERDEFEAFINLLNSQKDLENKEQNSNEIKSININDFERLERIGFGTFAKVFKVKEEKTGNIYAAKVIKSDSDKLSEDEKNCFKREIKIMFLLNHPVILKIHGFSPVNFSHKPQSTIIMEYESNGCLEDIMELERKGNSLKGWDSTKMHINIYGIALGMEYMHSLNIIHRDLKPANILEDDYLFPKICDFGLAKQLHQNPDSMTLISKQGLKGTPAYLAPEVILNEINTKASDVYAFGVMVYEMVSKKKCMKRINFN